jgi:hypothetical protein
LARTGGRTWWAHFEFTRINIQLTIPKNRVEEMLEVQQGLRFSGRQGVPIARLLPEALSLGMAA